MKTNRPGSLYGREASSTARSQLLRLRGYWTFEPQAASEGDSHLGQHLWPVRA